MRERDPLLPEPSARSPPVTLADSTAIEQTIAAAALVPACGMLLLSSTARLNVILARIRSFHAEMLTTWQAEPEPGSRAAAVRSLRLEGLDHQTHALLRRAARLRFAMVALNVAIGLHLAAILVLTAVLAGVAGGGDEASAARAAALVLFVLGLLTMGVAVVAGILEIAMATGTLHYEHERVARITASDPADEAGRRAAVRDAPPPAADEGERIGL